MLTAFLIVRILHILAGMLAFFVAPGALLTRKGACWHRRWGKIYFWSMAVVALTALPMAIYRANPFLLMVAIFSFYLAFSGYRILYHKKPLAGAGPVRLDWLAAGLGLLGSVGLICWGLVKLQTASFGIVAIVLGILGVIVSSRDMLRFAYPPTDKRTWLYGHMGNMLGAYIATVSAFSAVNLTFLPPVLRWLWPSLIGVPGLIAWIAIYKHKFAVGSRREPQKVEAQGREFVDSSTEPI